MVGTANALNISEAGYVTHDGSGVFHGRTFQAGTGITLTNASGVAGNTIISTQIAESTWVPVLSISIPGTSSVTYGLQAGYYWTQGNLVFITCQINLTNFTIGTGSGNVQISLPLSAGSTYTQIVPCRINNVAFVGQWVTGQIQTTTPTIININQQTTGASSGFLQATGLANNSIIAFTGCYTRSS